ncbi:MAG TPA: hypothetical protein VI072_03100 [Polyangiaceae bacterium]
MRWRSPLISPYSVRRFCWQAQGQRQHRPPKNDDIVIEGKNLVLDASAKTNIKASGDIVIKGSKIGRN